MRHQASISELKRSFMEAAPEPRPSQWEKRLTGSPAATSLRPAVPGVRVLLRRDSRHRPASRHTCMQHSLCSLSLFHVAVGLVYLFSLVPEVLFRQIQNQNLVNPERRFVSVTQSHPRGFLTNPDCHMTTSCMLKASLLLLISDGWLCDSDIRGTKLGRLQGLGSS